MAGNFMEVGWAFVGFQGPGTKIVDDLAKVKLSTWNFGVVVLGCASAL